MADETYQVFEDLKGILAEFDFRWVAETAGVSDQTLYNWHNGLTHKPRIDTITKVAKALGYEIVLELRETRRLRRAA